MYIHVNTYITPHSRKPKPASCLLQTVPAPSVQMTRLSQTAGQWGASWSQSFLGCAHSPWGLAENVEQGACLGLGEGSVLWPGHSCSCRSGPRPAARNVWPGAGLAALLGVCAEQVP